MVSSINSYPRSFGPPQLRRSSQVRDTAIPIPRGDLSSLPTGNTMGSFMGFAPPSAPNSNQSAETGGEGESYFCCSSHCIRQVGYGFVIALIVSGVVFVLLGIFLTGPNPLMITAGALITMSGIAVYFLSNRYVGLDVQIRRLKEANNELNREIESLRRTKEELSQEVNRLRDVGDEVARQNEEFARQNKMYRDLLDEQLKLTEEQLNNFYRFQEGATGIIEKSTDMLETASGKIDGSVRGLEEVSGRINGSVDGLETTSGKLHALVSSVEGMVTITKDQYESLKKENEELKREKQELTEKITHLESQLDELSQQVKEVNSPISLN